MTVAETL